MLIRQAMPILKELTTFSPAERREFFSKPERFKLFWYYHFPQNFIHELAPFHDDWIHDLTLTDLSILFEAFR